MFIFPSFSDCAAVTNTSGTNSNPAEPYSVTFFSRLMLEDKLALMRDNVQGAGISCQALMLVIPPLVPIG